VLSQCIPFIKTATVVFAFINSQGYYIALKGTKLLLVLVFVSLEKKKLTSGSCRVIVNGTGWDLYNQLSGTRRYYEGEEEYISRHTNRQ
jgi:hypothetical protein